MNHIHRPFVTRATSCARSRGVSIPLSDYLAHPICAYAEAGRCSTWLQALGCERRRVMKISVFAIGWESEDGLVVEDEVEPGMQVLSDGEHAQ